MTGVFFFFVFVFFQKLDIEEKTTKKMNFNRIETNHKIAKLIMLLG